MLERIFSTLGKMDPRTGASFGLARSLLAFGPLLTLLADSTVYSFHPDPSAGTNHCIGGGSRAVSVSLFCTFSAATVGLEVVRWSAILVLLLVVVGWRPRILALPHAYIAWSLQVTLAVPEGGDQLASNLAILMIPVCLVDRRRWHWSSWNPPLQSVSSVVAGSSFMLLRVQVAVVYFFAAVLKFDVEEWRDGTAIYYWLTDPTFGATGVRGRFADFVVMNPIGVTVVTWGTLALEVLLAASLLASNARLRRVLLVLGLLFHLGIGALMGLVSFSVVMAGALAILLLDDALVMRGFVQVRSLAGGVLSRGRRMEHA